MDSLQTARLCASYADDKKAEDIVLLDLRGLSPVTDFFVVCTAGSPPQLRAIRDEIVSEMGRQHQLKPLFVDGALDSQWVIVNFPNVLVHVQSAEKRAYYALEDLWGDAPRLAWSPESEAKPKPVRQGKAKAAAGKAVKPKSPKKAGEAPKKSGSVKAAPKSTKAKAPKARKKV